jgi:hypothetical protein
MSEDVKPREVRRAARLDNGMIKKKTDTGKRTNKAG